VDRRDLAALFGLPNALAKASMTSQETELEMVSRHVRESNCRIARQRKIIGDLRAKNRSTEEGWGRRDHAPAGLTAGDGDNAPHQRYGTLIFLQPRSGHPNWHSQKLASDKAESRLALRPQT